MDCIMDFFDDYIFKKKGSGTQALSSSIYSTVNDHVHYFFFFHWENQVFMIAFTIFFTTHDL